MESSFPQRVTDLLFVASESGTFCFDKAESAVWRLKSIQTRHFLRRSLPDKFCFYTYLRQSTNLIHWTHPNVGPVAIRIFMQDFKMLL